MRAFTPLLLSLALVAPAAAQPAAGRSPLAGDARLNKPVTVRWKKQTLYDALTGLSKLTGARL
ncbi:MAG TPA: hypothetical protein VFU47_15670, partial [Armatimonadota bacterium]|nr:hypothetical protein [Armatimonadota bacterium]